GDEGGGVGGEEHEGARDLFGFGPAPQQDPVEHRPGEALVRADGLGHGRGRQRGQRVDQDVLSGQFLGQRLGDAEDRGLGGGVVHLPERADQARGGGDVDDAPASVGGQVRQRRLRAVEGAHDVDVEQPPHGFCGGGGEHGGSGDAGGVDGGGHGAAGEGGGAG